MRMFYAARACTISSFLVYAYVLFHNLTVSSCCPCAK